MSRLKSQLTGTMAALALLTGIAALPQVATAQTTPTMKPNRVERHPELRAALRALENARNDLQKGAHDFGGERVEALKDTNKAIQEVQQAIAKDQH